MQKEQVMVIIIILEFFNDTYELKTSLNHKSIFNQNVEGLIGFHFQNKNQGAREMKKAILHLPKQTVLHFCSWKN